MAKPVLYVIGCASPPVRQITEMVAASQERGWDTCLILTPTARTWLAADIQQLEAQTGHPVRHAYKLPTEPDVLPPPTAIAVTPATFNTINKWAHGHSDNLALGLVTEAIGKGLPLVTIPFLNTWQAQHPAFPRSVEFLQAAGVKVLIGDDGYTPHIAGGMKASLFPWTRALDVLEPPDRSGGIG